MSSIHKNLNYPDNQRGWVLVVGLVILVMLTILSMALMKTTRLEEKMAGATRDMNLSFQAAETALRAAETFIESQNTDDIFNDTTPPGIYNRDTYEPGEAYGVAGDLFTIDWDVYSREIDAAIYGELEGVTILPRYMIKKMKKKIGATEDVKVFRVTARGTGGTNNRATLLQSHYARIFGSGSLGPEGRLSWQQLFPSQ